MTAMLGDPLEAVPPAFRETLRAHVDLDAAAGETLDAQSTLLPRGSGEYVALEGAFALLRHVRDGGESLAFESVLGQGGMGTVHLARQFSLDRRVAVKRVREDARSPAATLKLLREGWVTGSLEHPNVVPVYDLRVDAEGHPQIVLKKVDGSPWSEMMNDAALVRERFHAKDLLDWNLRVLIDVTHAVSHAHRRGIVHRDLKPENVMIGEYGEVYVVDWGIALALRDDGTGRLPLARDAKELAGTPCYMAPEMAGAGCGEISERTDVFLLGAVLLEAVTGEPPRRASSLLVALGQLFVPIPVPPDVPDELADVIRKATAIDPAERYASVDAFRRALEEFLAHRDSLELTRGAEERLADLLRESADVATQGDDRRLRLYHLFGECRFGFQQALRTWRDNRRAEEGLVRAIECMIELELSDGDPRAAAVLLASLRSPPKALAERVETARQRHDEERARRASVVDDHDPTVGRRTRAFVSLVMTSVWTLGPLVAYFFVRRSPEAESALGGLVLTGAVGLFGAGMALWARESLSKSAINRGLVHVGGLAILGQALLLTGALVSGMRTLDVQLALFVLWTTCAGFLATTVDLRFWPAALAYVVGFFVTSARPEWRYFVDAAANGTLMVVVAFVWGRDVDFAGYAKQQRDARHQTWSDFLERRRARTEGRRPSRPE